MIYETVASQKFPYFLPIMVPRLIFSSTEIIDIEEIPKAMGVHPSGRIWYQRLPNLIGVEDMPQCNWTYKFCPQHFISIEEAVSLVLEKFYPLRDIIKELLASYPVEAAIYVRIYVTNHSENPVEFEWASPILEITRSMVKQIYEMGTLLQFDIFSIDKFEILEDWKIISHCIDSSETYNGEYCKWVFETVNIAK